MDNEEDMVETEVAEAPHHASSGEIKLFAWLAILAAACFIAILTLQVIEFMGYSAHPSVWPASP